MSLNRDAALKWGTGRFGKTQLHQLRFAYQLINAVNVLDRVQLARDKPPRKSVAVRVLLV
jgi:hypothetical protein